MDLVNRLAHILAERTGIVAMGNYFRNDDAVGLHVLDALKEGRVRPNIELWNVEDILESYVFSIADKDYANVLLLDAVDCQANPGTVVFGSMDELEDVAETVSTHKISLRVAQKIFEQQGKKTYLLGIVARNIDYGNDMSKEIRGSAELLIKILKEIVTECH